jgi:hypothetical protein
MFTFDRLLAVVFGMLLAASPVSAGPPYITDDPGTAERGSFEFRLGIAQEWADGDDGLAAPELELAYGVTERLEIAVGTALNHAFRSGVSNQSGFADLSFGAKFRLLDQANGAPFSITTAPSISAPTGSESKGFSDGEWAGRLPIIFGYEGEAWSIAAEAGWSKSFDGSGRDGEVIDTGLLLQRQITERLNLGAEINGTHERTRGGVSAWVTTVGVIYDLTDSIALMGNVGAGLDRDAPDATLTAILQIVF